MPTLRDAFSTTDRSVRRPRIAALMQGLLAASMLCSVALPAHAEFWDGWFSSEADNKSDEQRAQLGPKRVPERNAGDRTAPESLMLEPASPNAAMQGMASAPVANNYAPSAYPTGQAAPYQAPMAELASPTPQQELYPAQPPMAAPAPQMDAAAQVTAPMAGNYGIPAGYGNAPAGAYGAASFDSPAANNTNGLAPVRATQQVAAENEQPAQKKPSTLLGWMGLSEDEPAKAPAPAPQQASSPQAYAPAVEQANAAPAPSTGGEGVEYYDANGFPILAGTPQNPPAPDHAANEKQMNNMIALNHAGEGTREAFMARGEDAFAPVAVPAELPSAQAPSALDELALSGYPSAQPAPQQAAPAPVAQAEPVYAPQYQQPAPQPEYAAAPMPAPAPAYEAPVSQAAQYSGDLLPPPALPDAAPQQQQAYVAAPAYNPPPAQAPAVQDFSGEIPMPAASNYAPAPAPVPMQAPAYAVAPEPVHVALTSNERAVPDYVPPAAPVAEQVAAAPQQPVVAVYNASPYGYAGPGSQVRTVPSQQATRYLPDSRYASRRQGNAKPGLYSNN